MFIFNCPFYLSILRSKWNNNKNYQYICHLVTCSDMLCAIRYFSGEKIITRGSVEMEKLLKLRIEYKLLLELNFEHF